MGRDPRKGRRHYSPLVPAADELSIIKTSQQIDADFAKATSELDPDDEAQVSADLDKDRIASWKRHYDALGR